MEVFNYKVNFIDNGVPISDPHENANAFNTVFTNLGPDLANHIHQAVPVSWQYGRS